MERRVGGKGVEDLHVPPRSSGISSMHVSILLLVLIRAPQRLSPLSLAVVGPGGAWTER